MLNLAQMQFYCYNNSRNVGLISFDVGIFTSYACKPEANVRFHQVTLNGNFLARVKAAFSMPQLAPAFA
jgi:hypothetical protein